MAQLRNVFSTRWGIVTVGALIGILATLLQKWGNPGNMGICVACFERDIAGALGLHRAEVVQYLRPEIIGFVLGLPDCSLPLQRVSSEGGLRTHCSFRAWGLCHDRRPGLPWVPLAGTPASCRG